MAFEKDIGAALAKACEFDSVNDAIHLPHAARIVHGHIFGSLGSKRVVKKEPVPSILLALVNTVLEVLHTACPSEHGT